MSRITRPRLRDSYLDSLNRTARERGLTEYWIEGDANGLALQRAHPTIPQCGDGMNISPKFRNPGQLADWIAAYQKGILVGFMAGQVTPSRGEADPWEQVKRHQEEQATQANHPIYDRETIASMEKLRDLIQQVQRKSLQPVSPSQVPASQVPTDSQVTRAIESR